MAELLTIENPELLRAQFEHVQPALMVAVERQEVGQDNSTYDQFMRELVGHPSREDYKPVQHPDRPESSPTYPYRHLQMFTQEGMLVVVRSTVPEPKQPEDYLVVTADLEQRDIRAWFVEDMNYPSYYTRTREFILSASENRAQPDGNVSVLPKREPSAEEVVLAGWRRSRRPRIFEGMHTYGFQKPGGKLELFAGTIAELDQGITDYTAAKQEPQQTAIIAA